VFIGIGINIFILSTLPEIVYTQGIYDIIYYVGTVIYVLFVAFTNYASLKYYKKERFNWLNIIITVLLLLILLGGKHFDLSYGKAIFESNNIILWGVDVPDLFYPCLLCSMLLFSVVPRKFWLRDNTVELKGIIFDNKVIVPFQKIRTYKKVVSRMYELFDEYYKQHEGEHITVCVLHVDALDKAEEIKKYVEENYSNVTVDIDGISPVISTHLGLGAVGFGWTILD